MAVQHLITRGFPSVPFLITQGLGAYGGSELPVEAPEALTYGAGNYERRVRAKWEEIEEYERRKAQALEDQKERDERLEELKRQQAELERRKKQESQKSALAKRKAKLAREIAEIEDEITAARAEIAQLIALILSLQSEAQASILKRNAALALLLTAA